MNEAATGATESRPRPIVLAARIARLLAVLFAAAAIGLVVYRRLAEGAPDLPDWPQHGLPGALAAAIVSVELLLRLVGWGARASFPRSGTLRRASYLAFALLLLPAAGAGYLALAASGPEPAFLGIPLAPIDPEPSLADLVLRFTGWELALGGVEATPIGAACLKAHGLLAAGSAMSLVAWLVLLMLHALRPASGASVLPGMAGQVSPEAQAFGGRLRFGGWLIFWMQLLVMISSALMFQLAQPDRAAPAERPPWYSEPIGWGFIALCAMGATLALAFLYTRLSGRIIAHPGRHLDPRRLFALWFLSLGILVGFFGVVMSVTALSMSASPLIDKIASQAPGIAIADATNFIGMPDMLILVANIELLMGHVLGVCVTRWLRIHASRARLDILRALVAAAPKPRAPPIAVSAWTPEPAQPST